MKLRHTLLFFISGLLFSGSVLAQDSTAVDTLARNNKYGLRVGIDLAKPMRTLLEDGYTGIEVVGDFRITENLYAATEIGTEEKERFESNLNSIASGSYIKIGADYNMYNNWLGMENAIYAGLRYGFSTFKQELLAYGIYTTDQTFPGTVRVDPQDFSGLTASWIELQVGVKAEIINNLYLSLNLQLKRKVSETEPENFANLYIPGFNRTYDFSDFGVGYGYTISYLIPIFKK